MYSLEQNGHFVPKRSLFRPERATQEGDVSKRQAEGRGGAAGRGPEQPGQSLGQAEPAARSVSERATGAQ